MSKVMTWGLVRMKCYISSLIQFSSVQCSRSVVSDSLRPHESQHARPPCPSPTPGVHPDYSIELCLLTRSLQDLKAKCKFVFFLSKLWVRVSPHVYLDPKRWSWISSIIRERISGGFCGIHFPPTPTPCRAGILSVTPVRKDLFHCPFVDKLRHKK